VGQSTIWGAMVVDDGAAAPVGKDKKAELPQIWPRDAPYIWVP